MRICLVGPTHPYRGGISHYTTLLYRHLKKKHDTLFIAFSRQYPKWLFPGKTDIDPSLSRIDEPCIQKILDSMNPVSWIRSALRVIKYQPDFIIIPWWVSFWAPQFWTISVIVKHFSNARLIFLCHNVVEHESGALNKLLTRMVLKKGDGFIVHSDEDLNNLKRILPGARVQKTFHPTYDVFNMADFNPGTIRSRYNITGNILLFFGFVRPYKGLKFLIKAMAKIVKSHDVTLMVVGEFWKDKDSYLSMIRALDLEKKVVVVDEYVANEEVGNYFCAADLVVQPYISATGSGVVQTAFAFEKPVLATRVGCLPEVIDHRKTGLLVTPGSEAAIAAEVTYFLDLKDKHYFNTNIRKENYKFSWNKLIETIEELIKRIG